MTTPQREQFANDAQAALAENIDDSQTTITLTDASEFPASGNYRLLIGGGVNSGGEVVLCTARTGNNTLTVVRGYEGTTAAARNTGATVAQILTRDSIGRWAQDNAPLWGYSGRPPLNTIVADDGETVLTASDFSWVNQGEATASDQGGTICLRAPADTGTATRILERPAPEAPYSYVAAFRAIVPQGEGTDVPWFGLGLREASTGKFTALTLNADSGGSVRPAVYDFASANDATGSTSPRARSNMTFIGPEVWLKVEDDGTDLTFAIGDGVEYVAVYTVSRTSHMAGGPDRVFFAANNYENSDCELLCRLCHWSRAA